MRWKSNSVFRKKLGEVDKFRCLESYISPGGRMSNGLLEDKNAQLLFNDLKHFRCRHGIH